MERDLFQARRLGDPDAIVEWARQALAEDPGFAELDDEALVGRWEEAVRTKSIAFAHAPTESSGEAGAAFLADCARVFGVEDNQAAGLVTEFHELDDPTRVGILLAIEESGPFQWLAPWIDEAPDDTPFVKPTAAMRTLLKRLLEKE